MARLFTQGLPFVWLLTLLVLHIDVEIVEFLCSLIVSTMDFVCSRLKEKDKNQISHITKR